MSEYESIVQELQSCGIPFAEYAWDRAPEGDYGVVAMDFEGEGLVGDDHKTDRQFSCSVDLFFCRLDSKGPYRALVEDILGKYCGGGWELSSIQYETSTGYFHLEWTFFVYDD